MQEGTEDTTVQDKREAVAAGHGAAGSDGGGESGGKPASGCLPHPSLTPPTPALTLLSDSHQGLRDADAGERCRQV